MTQGELGRIATNLARNRGYAVFPCLGDKKPACAHGCKDAVSDPERVAKLFFKHPGELIGVATGSASGVSVLDIDVKHMPGGEWWRTNCRRCLPTRVFETRAGGLHVFFRHRDGVRNSQGKLAAGVDTRGEGGYAIYWFAEGLRCWDHSPPAPWPHWLYDELTHVPAPPLVVRPQGDVSEDRLLAGLVRRVAGAREGERNSLLYWAACRCTERGLGLNGTAALLLPAAIAAGLPEHEVRLTLASAARAAA